MDNFTGRCVIALDPSLRIDQLKLPYRFLCEVLQPQIINILHKSMNWSYSDAYKYWYKGHLHNMDPHICKIIESIMWSNPQGLPLIINRNPSINYGSLLQMFCIGINDDYIMTLPYGILSGLAADFDGDVLNILYIINKEFYEAANRVLNPRNSMYISKNDGYTNSGVLPMRDILINANSLIYLSRDKYSSAQMAKINAIRNK